MKERLSVMWDGHLLNELFVICDASRPLMGAPSLSTQDVPGMDGTAILSSRLRPYEVAVTLAALDRSPYGMRSAFRTLASWLAGGGEGRLEFSDEPGLYRLATPSGAGDLETLGVTCGRAEVSFEVAKPWLYGETRSRASSGGSAAFTVGGTAPTPARIEAPSASGTYIVTDVATGDRSEVAVGGAAKALAIDADAGTVEVGGSAAMLSLGSDWLVLGPGAHTLARTSGSGEFTVSWTERWYG